jgi:hypothetical protein
MKTVNYNGHKFEVNNDIYKYNGLIINTINSLSPADFFKKYQGTKIMIQEMIAIENGKKRKIVIETVDEPIRSQTPPPNPSPPIDDESDNDYKTPAEHMVSRMAADDGISSGPPSEGDPEHGTTASIDKIVSFGDWKDYCEYRRDTHQMASKLYQKKNRYFVIPSILLASLSGTLSFFATSDSISNEDGQIMNLVVGTLAGVSGLIQSFAAAFKFAAKAESHQIAMESFDILLNKIRFKIARGTEGDEKDKDFLKMIETEIIEIKHRCKTLVPEVIERNYIDRNYRFIRNKELFGLKKAYIEKRSKELREILDNDAISTFENSLERNFNAV